MQVLLIDDDDDDVLFFNDALRHIYPAADLRRFASSEEAIQSINSEKVKCPDIIFIDINMPGSNGWVCLQQIRKIAGWIGIPTVMYSSAYREHVVIPTEVGHVAYYRKSDSLQEICTGKRRR